MLLKRGSKFSIPLDRDRHHFVHAGICVQLLYTVVVKKKYILYFIGQCEFQVNIFNN